ncbi:MAG: hydrogenase subunit MbhD domain-containing protein [Alkalispirochaeta sp.]
MTLIEGSFVLVLVGIVITAFAAVRIRNSLHAVIVLSVFGVLSTVKFAYLQAVDVAMAEAVIGAGFMTALFVTTIGKTRRSK